ncbi:MAG: hypothetical protein HOQ41_12630 [Ensifer adhaerens]|nr:hypothetical protein [Ensifer adhaerens]
MSSDNRLRHNPEDLELVRETMPQDVKEWVAQTIERMAGKVSAGLLDRLPDPHGALLPLLDAMGDGRCTVAVPKPAKGRAPWP